MRSLPRCSPESFGWTKPERSAPPGAVQGTHGRSPRPHPLGETSSGSIPTRTGRGRSGSSVPSPSPPGLRGALTSPLARSRESDPAAGPPPGHGRRDDDEDGRDDDADDPPDPVDALGCLDPQSCGDVVADQHTADAAEQGQPERDVVPVAGSDELAEQSDDQTCDENSDDLHDDAFHSGG